MGYLSQLRTPANLEHYVGRYLATCLTWTQAAARKHTKKWVVAPAGGFGPMQLCLAAGESTREAAKKGRCGCTNSGGIIRCGSIYLSSESNE